MFLKEDGSVTYIRFYLDNSSTKTPFSNVIVVENGFYGAIFVKEDGTALSVSLTKLDELTNQK